MSPEMFAEAISPSAKMEILKQFEFNDGENIIRRSVIMVDEIQPKNSTDFNSSDVRDILSQFIKESILEKNTIDKSFTLLDTSLVSIVSDPTQQEDKTINFADSTQEELNEEIVEFLVDSDIGRELEVEEEEDSMVF